MKSILLITSLLFSTCSFAYPKLHVLLTADSDSNIGLAVNIDKANIQKLFANIANHFDASVFHSISASALSEKSITSKIESMRIGTDDVVVFYYSGHGDRSKISADWPVLTPHNKQKIEVLNVITTLNAQVPRQVIVIIDACNGSFSPLDYVDRLPASGINGQAVNRLFKQFKGSVLVTSSLPGFVSYTINDNKGSVFTFWFGKTMNKFLSSESASWTQILQETKNKVIANNNAQTPKYIIKKL